MTNPITRRTTPLVWDIPTTPPNSPALEQSKKPVDGSYYNSSIASLSGSRKKASDRPADWFSAVGNWVKELFLGNQGSQENGESGTEYGELPHIPQLAAPVVRSKPSVFHEKALQMNHELNKNLQNLHEEDDSLKNTPNGDFLRQLFACYMDHKVNREEASTGKFEIIQRQNNAKKALQAEVQGLIDDLQSRAKTGNLVTWVERGTAVVAVGALAYSYLITGKMPSLQPGSAFQAYLSTATAATRLTKFNIDYNIEKLDGKKVIAAEQTNLLEKKIGSGLDSFVQMQEELARIIRCIRNHLNNHHQAAMQSIRAR